MANILVLSDIHQDDRALESLLKHAKDYDCIWFLGDVVGHEDHTEHKYNGYKGDIQACYDLLKYSNAHCIIGNWEDWLLTPENDSNENAHQQPYSRELSQARLTLAKNGILEWIHTWPELLIFEPFTLVHGSIDSDGVEGSKPNETYITPEKLKLVKRIFLHNKLTTPHMLFGHTHIPGYFVCNNDHMPEWIPIKEADLNKEVRYNIFDHSLHFVINPGSLSLNRTGRMSNKFWNDALGTALQIDTKNAVFRYLPVTAA